MIVRKLFWIDDMDGWSSSAQKNLELISGNYGVSFKFLTSRNGEDADIIKKMEQYDFDAVIMDYHMDPFNGDKYIKEIREVEHLEHIPILFYSQDTSTNLAGLVFGLKNVTVVYRPNLEDKIKELFFK